MSDEAQTVDPRGWLRRWWEAQTIAPADIEDHLVARVTVVLSVRDRLLVLLGRDIDIEQRSTMDPGRPEWLGALRTSARTVPRSWR